MFKEQHIVIKGTMIIIQYARRAFRLHKLISDTHIEIFIKPNKYKVEEHSGSKIQNVVPNTAKVIYAWNKKILSFSKNSKFCKQEIYKNDHIIDNHANTEMLTTGLVIPS